MLLPFMLLYTKVVLYRRLNLLQVDLLLTTRGKLIIRHEFVKYTVNPNTDYVSCTYYNVQ